MASGRDFHRPRYQLCKKSVMTIGTTAPPLYIRSNQYICAAVTWLRSCFSRSIASGAMTKASSFVTQRSHAEGSTPGSAFNATKRYCRCPGGAVTFRGKHLQPTPTTTTGPAVTETLERCSSCTPAGWRPWSSNPDPYPQHF